MPTPIPERANVTAEVFENEILPAARPVVFRGLVKDWPVVRAGIESPQALCAYVRRFDRGNSVSTMHGPPSIKGRFFYSEDLSGFNFQQGTAKLIASFDYLLQQLDQDQPAYLAVQSVPTRANLPGFEADNPMPLLNDVEPRVWIGNSVIVAAHHDPSENIAACTAGRRRFTLFAPEQLPNLYMGPFEMTPAGATISMVDFDKPDFERYPRFRDALEASHTADLEPGDAIYIPYLWWHHVRSLERFNMLVNYWWAPPANGRGRPQDAFLVAALTIKALPPPHRQAWREIFNYYIFQDDGPPGAHLPEERRGILGDLSAEAIRAIRAQLARTLSRK
ncbi:MAG TPA: cupin-like domain-containing protein [Caulobacterales bacterium]|nr:cupin-like domain-containing protein [Caulobacterales bacterium]